MAKTWQNWTFIPCLQIVTPALACEAESCNCYQPEGIQSTERCLLSYSLCHPLSCYVSYQASPVSSYTTLAFQHPELRIRNHFSKALVHPLRWHSTNAGVGGEANFGRTSRNIIDIDDQNGQNKYLTSYPRISCWFGWKSLVRTGKLAADVVSKRVIQYLLNFAVFEL